MEDLHKILIREEKRSNNNSNNIYLYKVDGYWLAYERSAFYLYSICRVDYIFRCIVNKNMLLVALLKDKDLICKPQFEITETCEEQIVLHCSIICKGFEHWKSGITPLCDNIGIVPRIQQVMSSKTECD